jgi:hypothetical protein
MRSVHRFLSMECETMILLLAYNLRFRTWPQLIPHNEQMGNLGKCGVIGCSYRSHD